MTEQSSGDATLKIGDAVFYYPERTSAAIRTREVSRVTYIHPLGDKDAPQAFPSGTWIKNPVRIDLQTDSGKTHLNVMCSAEAAARGDLACWQEIFS